MDAHIKRRKTFVNNSLQVSLGEASHGRKIPEKETQSVVIVLHIQTAAHTFWQLIDETELAMVVACMNSIKYGARD